MKVTFQQVEKLLKGDQKFEQFAFAMLLTRMRERYAKNSSPATVESSVEEINAFLSKNQAIMAGDYAIMKNM